MGVKGGGKEVDRGERGKIENEEGDRVTGGPRRGTRRGGRGAMGPRHPLG